MSRASGTVFALAAALALPAGALAKTFTVSNAGNHPSVAVDASGTAHVVWDVVDRPDADDATSTTYYCKVPRGATSCAKGSTRTFSPAAGEQDFAGPRVFLTGASNVVV